jgi:hypothetical protein
MKKGILLTFCLILLPLLSEAENISVTVYNSNLGVVSEDRALEFEKGINRLAIQDIPQQIDVNSVRFELPGSRSSVSILEQNFAYDLVNPDKMYNKYVDKEIELIDKDGKLYGGKLLSHSNQSLVLQEESGQIKIILLDNLAEVNFPVLPDGLITRPTLFWLYQSDQTGTKTGRLSYQTRGMGWTAEYVGVLNETETKLGLSGWAAIQNNSGKTFADATLKLVAGDIHRAAAKRPPSIRTTTMADMERGAGFEEKEFFEYHLYTLPRKTTLSDREKKQISLFEPASAKVKKIFIYQPDRNPTQVKVALNFVNSTSAGLGLPLPAGRVRLFQADEDGSLILLGEDKIAHTPRDEELKLTVGYAFDLVAKESLVKQERISSKVEEREMEIELRNRKEDPVTIQVEKKIWGFWEIIESTHEYKQKDANTVIFEVPVPAGETATVTYRVRFTSR